MVQQTGRTAIPTANPTAASLVTVTPERKLRYHFHPGQLKAWDSTRRIVCVLAGTQGGKTTFGSPWLYREIQHRGPGDYMVVTPSYPLMNLKALPSFLQLFRTQLALGDYNTQAKTFTFSATGAKRTWGYVTDEPTRVYFGHAQDPDSLESATAKAIWLDEAGQKKFRLGSWEALQRRGAIHQARVLITTTPYNLGWLKLKIWDRWKAGDKSIDVVRFDSLQNPAFPREEFEKARRDLPAWKFDLYYRALFSRPAGLIYDAFDEQTHKVPRFKLPDHWQRYLGLDFGGVNTAGIFLAEEPGTGKLYAYREYHAGGRTAAEHAKCLLAGEVMVPMCVGGSKSEGQWRDEFRAGGLPVQAPEISEIEVGIDRVYGAIKRGELYVFADLEGTLEELATYSRPLDEAGNPMEGIENQHDFHLLDATRYIIGKVKRASGPPVFGTQPEEKRRWFDAVPKGVFQT